MIGDRKTGLLEGVLITGSAKDGLTATVNGLPARFALVTEDGAVHASDGICREAFNVSVNAYRDFLRGQGYLRTLSRPMPT